jgi:transcriptional regulator with XRE-family HTH domain
MTETGRESIGARFRTAREQSGLSLRQIADATKLSVRALQAVETDRVSQLPGGIYRRAIVRNFAREIRLDPEVILREFLAEHPDDLPALPPLPTRKPTSYDLPPEPEVKDEGPRVWRTVLSLIGALIPIVAGVLYFTIALRGDDVPRHVADVMPPRAAEVWQPEIVPAAGFSEATPFFGRPLALMITVSSPCELQVVVDGREVVARKLVPGELIQLDLSHEVVLSGDNAGAVHVSLNGRAGRRFGAAGSPLNVRIGREDYDLWLARP